MKLYGCDFCEEIIGSKDAAYLVKVTKLGDRETKPKTICLCEKCKKSWGEKIPQLFD